MSIDPQKARLEGVYEQRTPGTFMHRVKIPGGVMSAEQAVKVADIADRFAGGRVHLTTRGSIEFHDVAGQDLTPVGRMLAAVGLTGRGACGGAVRGVTCSTPFLPEAAGAQRLARRLHHHFTHNPRFEGLPKKFKIGVDAGYTGARHLIQDLGLVLVGETGGSPCYDVWCAGGLGREPHPALLLAERVPEERILPLAEAVITVYRQGTPAGKRLKHLVRGIGEEEFRGRVAAALDPAFPAPLPDAVDRRLTLSSVAPIQAGVFAGEVTAESFRKLAEIGRDFCGGFMTLTGDQNVAFVPETIAGRAAAATALAAAGYTGASRDERVTFRVCPGSHECRMGLAPTRDVAREVLAAMGVAGETREWAIAGCPNSCSQPQLADTGIVTVKLLKGEDGVARPRFDLLRRETDGGFGTVVKSGIGLEELLLLVED
jgi:sulfite reductase (ferredoxin)